MKKYAFQNIYVSRKELNQKSFLLFLDANELENVVISAKYPTVKFTIFDSIFTTEPSFRLVSTTFMIKKGVLCEIVLEDRER